MSNLLSQASLVMIPSGYKEDVVYSPIPTTGAGDLSFTRASNGTRINSAGLVEVVPWNLLEYSNTFSNANWGLSDATVTGSQAGYDGTNNAWKLQSSGGTNTYIAQGSYSAIRTQSVYAKAGNTSKFSIIVGGYGNGMQFDLSNGTIVTNSNSSYFSGSITSVGSGWYYIVVTIQATAPTYAMLVAPQNLSSGGITLGDYVFIQNAQLNIGSTAKPYFPTTDRLNVPRLTYQNGGGGCPSLLLEKQSTNLLSYSEQFDNVVYDKTGGAITANSTTSPDGTTNADSFIEDSSTGFHFLQQAFTASAISYTYTVYAKNASGTRKLVLREGVSTGAFGTFDLVNGTVTNSGAGGTASIESVGNGWYRCAMTFTAVAGASTFQIFISNASTFASYTGNGTSGFYLYGAQVEASSYPTSYIPTTSASATRVADVCSKTGISSLIGQTEGVLFADVTLTTRQSFSYILINDSGSSANYIGIYYRSTAFEIEVVNGGGLQANIISNNSATGRFKIAIAYKSNDFVLYINGTQIGTDTSGSVPTCNKLDLFYNGEQPFQINQAILFPTRLTNAELASLTTL